MKKGLIIYNDHDKKLNEWFVESCLKSLNNDEIDTNALLETFKYNFATNLLNEIKSDDLTLDTKDIT